MKAFLRAAPRLMALLLVVLSLVLSPYSEAPAQASAPRLVVFEGFYNPG